LSTSLVDFSTFPLFHFPELPMTDVIRVDPAVLDRAALLPAAERLRGGGLVAFPTETVYGLGAHALDPAAVRRIFEAKARPATDPLIIHVARMEDVERLVMELPETARTLAARFWPGALTLVMRRAPAVPDEVTAGLPTVALRMPSHPVARALIELAAVPVAAPSANLFSRPSPTRAAHVLEDLNGRIDMVVDGGPAEFGIESTVLDLATAAPTILRSGAVTLEMLRKALPGVSFGAARSTPIDGIGTEAMPSPGMLDKHYSPRAPMTLYEGAGAVDAIVADARLARNRGQKIGILSADEDRRKLGAAGGVEGGPPLRIVALGPLDEIETIASRLYAGMRELDAAGVDLILARSFPARGGLGVAVQDRMRRAAGNRIAT
jgi:L-threonylcarbamoyladenylate synthase